MLIYGVLGTVSQPDPRNHRDIITEYNWVIFYDNPEGSEGRGRLMDLKSPVAHGVITPSPFILRPLGQLT